MTLPTDERRFLLGVYRALGPSPGTFSSWAVAEVETRQGVDFVLALSWLKSWEERGWWCRPDRLSLLRGGAFTPAGFKEVAYQAAVEVKTWKEVPGAGPHKPAS